MIRGWCIRSRAPQLWLTPRGQIPAGVGSRLSHDDALRAVTSWVASGAMDVFERRAFGEVLRGARLRGTLEQALRDGTLLVWREEARALRGGAASASHTEDAAPAPTRVNEQDTWITVELINEADEPVHGVTWRVVLPDESVREGTLPGTGAVHLRGITAGACKVSFTSLDGEAWARVGEGAPYIARGDEGEGVTVVQGDTTESLAYARGLFWETVWDHPNNAALRAKGRRPNILLPGDVLFLPARVTRDERCATAKVHRFRRRGVPTTLAVRCLDPEGNPYANAPYQIVAGAFDRRGVLDGDGWLRCWLPLEHRRLQLLIGENGEDERYELLVGHLDPNDEDSGVCDRLRNLGYYSGPSVGADDPRLAGAVRWFRRSNGLPEGDEIDDALREALKRGHRA